MKKLFYSLLLLPLLGMPLLAQDTQIFLKDIQKLESTGTFKVVDMDHDESGNTYVLGESSGKAVIVKYDATGVRQTFSSPNGDISISNFIPVAMDVVGTESGGYIFVASSKRVYRFNTSNGAGGQRY